FVHELGHFLVAKWAGVRVEQFAIGFFREVVGFTRGETRYSFNLLPLGGYVKMLGQEDFEVDTTGELQYKDDPRSFANKSVGKRMAIVSAGVVMNLLLAGLLFMIVFLVGKKVPSPQVGAVVPDSPAATAGLETGDRIVRINGTAVDEFNDINMAVMLAKPGEPLHIEAMRGDTRKDFDIEPERSITDNLPRLGITSAQSAYIVDVGPDYNPDAPDSPHVGDRIVRLGGPNGPKVTEANANEMMNVLFTDPLAYSQAVVARPIGDAEPKEGADVPTKEVTVKLKPRIILKPVDFSDNPPNLLGLAPLRRFSMVKPGGRADLAGIKPGDIIVGIGKLDYPTGRQIEDAILASTKENPDEPERDIPIRVIHADTGKEERLVLRPRVKTVPLLNKTKPPQIEATFDLPADNLLRVAKVVPEAAGRPTPFAEAGVPAGALIRAVNDQPVTTWTELAEHLRAEAGKAVTVTYDTPEQKDITTTIHVPQSLRTALGIGPGSIIMSLNGEETVDVTRNGKTITAAVNDPAGLHAALKDLVGKTVAVRYRANLLGEAETADVTITPEMLYPWVAAVGYTVDMLPGGQMSILRKSNPLDALAVGARKTYYFVVQVYQVMERMIVSRSLGVENISGPVGIVKLGKGMAEKSWVDLLFFLAIISANLAVINFLPLPIVDGGLMVFLIIEKIKGSPISVRVQVATQVVGLILIGSAFAFVTIQDFFR
ncbi:MAG TPA: site-2 protease family protein, partial [Phycisphaerae bacterium]|nr:site-2 protease family protein [Phycisphaerae bacterium]